SEIAGGITAQRIHDQNEDAVAGLAGEIGELAVQLLFLRSGKQIGVLPHELVLAIGFLQRTIEIGGEELRRKNEQEDRKKSPHFRLKLTSFDSSFRSSLRRGKKRPAISPTMPTASIKPSACFIALKFRAITSITSSQKCSGTFSLIALSPTTAIWRSATQM